MFRFALVLAAVAFANPVASACAMYIPDDRDVVAALDEIDAAVAPEVPEAPEVVVVVATDPVEVLVPAVVPMQADPVQSRSAIPMKRRKS